MTHKINNHNKRQGIFLLKDRAFKRRHERIEKVSLQNTWKKLPSKGKSLYRGPEAGVAGSVKEQPRGFLLRLECSEPGRENIRSRSSKGLFGLLRTLLFLLSTRENHVEFRTINCMM